MLALFVHFFNHFRSKSVTFMLFRTVEVLVSGNKAKWANAVFLGENPICGIVQIKQKLFSISIPSYLTPSTSPQSGDSAALYLT